MALRTRERCNPKTDVLHNLQMSKQRAHWISFDSLQCSTEEVVRGRESEDGYRKHLKEHLDVLHNFLVPRENLIEREADRVEERQKRLQIVGRANFGAFRFYTGATSSSQTSESSRVCRSTNFYFLIVLNGRYPRVSPRWGLRNPHLGLTTALSPPPNRGFT